MAGVLTNTSLDATAGKLCLNIEQGTTYCPQFQYLNEDETPIDITGWDMRMQIRSSVTAVAFIWELTVTNGGIIIGPDPTNGEFSLFILDTDTDNFTFRRAVYDLEAIDGAGKVYRLLEGKVKLHLQVTR